MFLLCSESISGISDAPTAHPGSDIEATEVQVAATGEN